MGLTHPSKEVGYVPQVGYKTNLLQVPMKNEGFKPAIYGL